MTVSLKQSTKKIKFNILKRNNFVMIVVQVFIKKIYIFKLKNVKKSVIKNKNNYNKI